MKAHTGEVTWLGIDDEGNLLSTGKDNFLKVWKVNDDCHPSISQEIEVKKKVPYPDSPEDSSEEEIVIRRPKADSPKALNSNPLTQTRSDQFKEDPLIKVPPKAESVVQTQNQPKKIIIDDDSDEYGDWND